MATNEITIYGWRGAFLARTSPQLSLAGSICSIGLTGAFMVLIVKQGRKYDAIRRNIKERPDELAQLSKQWLKTIVKSTRVVRGFGLIFLLLALAIIMTDGYISLEALVHATKTNPNVLGAMPLCNLATQLGLSIVYATVFSLLIPLTPILLTTHLFNRQSATRGPEWRDNNIVTVGYGFASVGMFAAMVSYFIALRWPPMEALLLRFALFQISFFSGLAWSLASQRIVCTGGALWRRNGMVLCAEEYAPLMTSRSVDEKV
ncbi:Hypothetical protein R9X50_00042200 [Acrodontium crateriforme]|uniref:Uncharacterized protein n=1 Tax=Acrodontium crateriforme TaxID=150365 RepID=A0AAQ3R956_9PEZI|nr:Hypothetical protein R9X50_00042200 [Acrodontium crateriforme]